MKLFTAGTTYESPENRRDWSKQEEKKEGEPTGAGTTSHKALLEAFPGPFMQERVALGLINDRQLPLPTKQAGHGSSSQKPLVLIELNAGHLLFAWLRAVGASIQGWLQGISISCGRG